MNYITGQRFPQAVVLKIEFTPVTYFACFNTVIVGQKYSLFALFLNRFFLFFILILIFTTNPDLTLMCETSLAYEDQEATECNLNFSSYMKYHSTGMLKI